MRILLTGASSFTGSWFVDALATAGHEVVATFRREVAHYDDALRRARVERILPSCRPLFGVETGDGAFLAAIRDFAPDVLCLHAARVEGYRSPDFDALAALADNTRNLPACFAAFAEGGGRRVVLTGSVFEAHEGRGTPPLHALSAYGLSKTLTSEVVRFQAAAAGLHLGKFVIPNPFGPWEEARFTAYLLREWCSGRTPVVRTPDYVRDNVHVDLLARRYERFVATLPDRPGESRSNPSGYVESQGAFAQRFAREMAARLALRCDVELAVQTEWSEPIERVNTEPCDARALGWDEAGAWDAIARFYAERHTIRPRGTGAQRT
jgi:nucleoside-diphosphate-sugar epimerase